MNTILTYGRVPSLALICATAAWIGCGTALAEDKPAGDAAAAPEKKKTWETSAAAGATITRGNSDTLLVTLSLDTKHKWEQNELTLGVSGGYGKNNSVKNTEFIQGYGQYNRLFSERFYAGLRLDANYDGIANLDYRLRVSPLVGYYLVKNEKMLLSVEAGPSAVFEKYKGENEETYLGFRLGERFEYKLTKTTKLWESVDYVPRVDKWTEKYVITSEVGISTSITEKWSLRVVFQDIYDSAPAADRKANDLRLIAGTEYKF